MTNIYENQDESKLVKFFDEAEVEKLGYFETQHWFPGMSPSARESGNKIDVHSGSHEDEIIGKTGYYSGQGVPERGLYGKVVGATRSGYIVIETLPDPNPEGKGRKEGLNPENDY